MSPVRRDRSASAFSGRRIGTREGGFTLIELLLVTAIIVTLAAFAVGGIIGAKQRATMARSKAELALLAQALEDYKRHYGDYPQTGAAAQASQTITGTTVIGSTQAQALLFNALTGVYGPTNFTARVNGPMLVDVSKFALEAAPVAATFAVPTGSPPAKPLVANSFLDPWGRRYLYYYKNPRNTTGWQTSGFVLYSAGPDGAQTPPNVNTGLYTGTAQSTGTNADNLYADKLP